MDLTDLPEDSDTSDEDYMPNSKPEDVLSEVDSDGDPEDPLSDTEGLKHKGQKRRKKTVKGRKKQKNDEIATPADPEPSPSITKEEEKKQDDDLWADFIKDTGFRPKTIKNETVTKNDDDNNKTNSSKITSDNNLNGNKIAEKIKVTQIFEFAGEEVQVEKEVYADSAEARLLNKAEPVKSNRGRGSLSGISSVLNQLGKKPKISTLEKSKLDWDKFKKEENIEEELHTYNKGKDGYLERQDFLQRADLRRFEIEKEIRSVERNKRLNN